MDTPDALDTADALDTLDTADTLDTLDTPDTLDTLALARLDRECQGPWEAEYSYGEEADLHRHYDSCNKNPGHENFISVDKFKIGDLPESYRDQDVVDYIRAMSGLTVRVSVRYVSENRPATGVDSSKTYAGYNAMGRKRVTFGTGYVNDVEISEGVLCKCKECQNSKTPELSFATFTIHTTTHVVFDELEGQHTTCDLFFDRGDTPDTCPGVVTLKGMFDVESEVNEDVCHMKHYTHDLDLAYALQAKVKEMCEPLSKMGKSYGLRQTQVDTDIQPLLFIVSHPHGCSKQVSLGRWTRAEMFTSEIAYLLYNAATCPGSSGAPTCVMAAGVQLPGVQMRALRALHRGISTLLPEFNYGCIEGDFSLYLPLSKLAMATGYSTPDSLDVAKWDLEYQGMDTPDALDTEDALDTLDTADTLDTLDTPDTLDTLALARLDRECQGITEVDELFPETDLYSRYAKCKKKKPGHINFIPLHLFGKDHLPPGHSHPEKHIKALEKITALVLAKHVSKVRPQTFPGTNRPNPLTSWRETAWVHKVLTFSERNRMDMGKCPCKECLNSGDRKTEFAHKIINTAAHVVFNESDAKHTTCYLFYDAGRTVEDCEGVVKLSEMSSVWSDAETGVCNMLYVTHDLDVIHREEKVVNEWESAQKGLEFMNKIKSKSLRESPSPDISHQPLAIVVSHPHGCSKQVSIGYCVSVDDKG